MNCFRSLLLIICNLFFSELLFAQADFNQIGGRSIAVSGASVTYQDVWSQYHNQAGLAFLKGINIGLGFQNAFLVKELSTKSISVAIPLKSGVFGINYGYFGYPKFNENKIGLAFAKALGKRIAVGIQLDYQFTHIDGDYGNKATALGEVGILTEPIDNLLIGAHVFNVWRSKLSTVDNEYIPTIFTIGASYRLYDIALLSIEFEKDLDLEMVFKSGLEFELIENFSLRAGIATNPNIFSFGLGYTFQSFDLNIAFSKHPVLGYSPGVSIIYAFKDRL
jgi:hypothetical protein